MPNNDLLNRYLQAVKFWLPKAQQRDILAELAEDLHSQVEERESALGHSLDEAELAEILKQRGAPLRVASSYIPEQRLINPAMMAVYRMVLKIVLLWVLAPLFAVILLGSMVNADQPGHVLVQFWAQAWQTGFMVVGMVTVVFALLDRYHTKIKGLDDWDPRKLPRVTTPHDTSARCNYFAGVVFGAAAAFCWVYFMWNRYYFDFPGGGRWYLGPIWQFVNWVVLGVTVTNASADLLAFLYSRWARVRSGIRLATDVCTLILMAVLLNLPAFAAFDHQPNDNWALLRAHSAQVLQPWAADTVKVVLLCIVAGTLIDAVMQLRILLRDRPAKSAPVLLAS